MTIIKDGYWRGRRSGYWWAVHKVYRGIHADCRKRAKNTIIFFVHQRIEESAEIVLCEDGVVYSCVSSRTKKTDKYEHYLTPHKAKEWIFIQPVMHPWRPHALVKNAEMKMIQNWIQKVKAKYSKPR